MLGNLGYSNINCVNLPAEVGSLTVTCNFGTIGQITNFGISNKADGNPTDQCMINDANRACEPNSQTVLDAKAASIGAGSSSFLWTASSLYAPGSGAGCVNEDSLVFVQFTCVQDVASQHDKFNTLITSESIAILIGLLFYVMIRGLYQGGKLGAVEWDINTVTASDYTVMWEVHAETYEAWDGEREADPNSSAVAEGYAFKDKIKKDMEALLADTLRRYKDEQGENLKYETMVDKTEVIVADIQFAYNNPELINTLKARGYAISMGQWAVVQKKDEELIRLMSDEDNREKFSRPITAFITFEEEDGYIMALDLSTENQLKIK